MLQWAIFEAVFYPPEYVMINVFGASERSIWHIYRTLCVLREEQSEANRERYEARAVYDSTL